MNCEYIVRAVVVGAMVVTSLVLCGKSDAAQRSQAQRHLFARTHACPATHLRKLPCPGYIIDHVNPLCKGGPDLASNMQWQTVAAAKAKDKWECRK